MQNTTSSKSPTAETTAAQKAQVEIPTPAATSKIGAKLRLGKKSPPPGTRTAGDTTVVSWRLTAKGMAAFEILKALHPDKKIIDLISDILELAAAQVEATPPTKFNTLNGSEFLLIKGAIATLISALTQFRADLLKIDQYPDDAKRTEALAELTESTEEKLHDCHSLFNRISRIAQLPGIPDGPEFRLLLSLSEKLIELEANATPEEIPIYTLGRKLLNVFLP